MAVLHSVTVLLFTPPDRGTLAGTPADGKRGKAINAKAVP